MILALSNISFERDHQTILQTISITVQPGECLQILGANGSGKSTLLKIMAGLLSPDTGEIIIDRQDMHYISHKNGIKLALTVMENLRLQAAIAGEKFDEQKAVLALQQLDLILLRDRLASQLSAGQLRRVCLAKLLLTPRKIWLLDEPTTALDADSQRLFASMLEKHLQQGGMATVATHQMIELQQIKLYCLDLSKNDKVCSLPASLTLRDCATPSLPTFVTEGIVSIIYHEIIISLRHAFSWVTPLLFFVLVVCLFPLSIGPDTSLIQQAAPGIIWVCALLAILISLGSLFKNDADDGSLDAVLLSSRPLILLVGSKLAAFWLTHCLPFILISPVLGILLQLQVAEIGALCLSLLLGTPVLILLGAIGSALIVGIRGNGLLLPMLIMPLYIPVLIFGTSMMIAANQGTLFNGQIALMMASLLVSIGFAPLFTGMALRIGANE